ncbi:SGNH/GDSL hydrolase family protein [Arenibacter aquaticus]|uniref:SGNH/GDSL hydrolase family protein n=1 Tax=Arenibacter aquaticus TaxID=2489054 RepID=A0A430K6U7_9FLAO|nr:SGNH/GDSL hydrolase family protein [Arenibacter aquaticus]RTE54783.1 SGNH/GDSL hydrolase family protein [Arenibacter aquaticus]
MRRVVVIGDSSMWGQGLREDQKYAFLYVEKLREQGFDYELDPKDFLAHSGAIIGDFGPEALTSEGLPKLLATSNRTDHSQLAPEVPTDYPSIYKQVADISDPESVSLLVMNGGMNDVGMMSAVNTDAEHFRKNVHKNIRQVAKTRLKKLMERIVKTLPNAQIVFVGYYPALGPKSRLPMQFYQLVGAASGLVGNIGVIPAFLLANDKIEDFKRQALELHQGFQVQASLQIAEFNSINKTDVLFCYSGFEEKNAIYGSGVSFVFAPLDSSDPIVHEGRRVYCRIAYDFDTTHLNDTVLSFDMEELSKEEIAYVICTQAYLLHPNEQGAKRYAKSMEKIVTPYIKFSLRESLSQITNGQLSIRQATSKFRFHKHAVTKIKMLRELCWLHTIIVQFDLNLQVAPSDPDIFPSEGLFDLGWGQERLQLSLLGPNTHFSKYAIMECHGERKMNEITQFQIFLPLINPTIVFRLNLKLFANGYELARSELAHDSFVKRGDFLTWRVMIN